MHPRGHALSNFGATILGVEGLRLSSREKALYRDADPFGFILFARNIDAPDQVRALCDELREAVGRDALITIDQEGGRVQRLRGPLWREWTAPLDHVIAAGEDAAHAMYLRFRLIAAELRDLGIDSNCAPLVDVAAPETHDFLRNRCYGCDPGTVSRIGRAVADGLLQGGVLPVVKHIPGHGRAVVDSHLDLPVVFATRRDLDTVDFAPFRALNDLPLGMTAHLVYQAIDPRPATTSPVMMNLIRQDIGFDGLIMTDDISMKALSGSLQQISLDALQAGCDVILHCNGNFDEMQAVTGAAGRLGDNGQRRADQALKQRKIPVEVDIPALEAKLGALIAGHGYV